MTFMVTTPSAVTMRNLRPTSSALWSSARMGLRAMALVAILGLVTVAATADAVLTGRLLRPLAPGLEPFDHTRFALLRHDAAGAARVAEGGGEEVRAAEAHRIPGRTARTPH